ncbi:hypothetical protein [Methylibium rhizosphaerae]|uniref:hypothetical protein n=1 Tax=Methylibium rhizosphaerae TaxID=2570323 RepID=UPI00112DAF98|nr:hypothetical protein [Methylibium rhizosphaerae]
MSLRFADKTIFAGGFVVETLKELLGAVRSQIQERVASPLTGAFVISWGIWNFKLILVVFGDGPYKDKVSFIETQLYPGWDMGTLRGIAYPALTALAYIYLYLPLAKHVMAHHKRRQNEMRALAAEIDGTKVLTVDQATELREQLRRRQAQWVQQRQDLEAENAALQQTVAELQRRLSETHPLATHATEEFAQLSPASNQPLGVSAEVLGNGSSGWRVNPEALMLASKAAKDHLGFRPLEQEMIEALDALANGLAANQESSIDATVLTEHDSARITALERMIDLGFIHRYPNGQIMVTPAGHELLTVLRKGRDGIKAKAPAA